MVLAHRREINILKTINQKFGTKMCSVNLINCSSPVSKLFRVSQRTDPGDDISAFLDTGKLAYLDCLLYLAYLTYLLSSPSLHSYFTYSVHITSLAS